MNRLFLGKPVHWIMIAALIAIMWWMGSGLMQTRSFNLFLAVLLGLSAAAVATVLITTRRGEQVTREPFEDDESPARRPPAPSGADQAGSHPLD